MNKAAKGIATVAAAAICAFLMWLTHGEHGIGWFIAALVIIFGSN